MNIIFFGTSEFASIILEKLMASDYKPGFVVTMPDKPIGRKQIITPSPVKSLVLKNKTWDVSILQPEKLDSNFRIQLLNLDPDLCVVASYGQIIPKNILQIPKYGFLNIHPSLLPKYRGASPIQTTILNGDEKTGLTVMLMDEKMDHGQILAQQELDIPIYNLNFSELHKKLANLGVKLLIKTIPAWVNEEIKPKEQEHSKATFTKIIKKEDGLIDWKEPAKEIERKIRAFREWPGSFTIVNIQSSTLRLKILKAQVLEMQNNIEPGKFFLTTDKKLAIKCGEGSLVIQEIQPEGKNPMSSNEFINGYSRLITK